MDNFPTQGNDPRTNDEKPATTWQEYTPSQVEGEEGVLKVHINDDPNSPLYFEGKPSEYKGEAVKQEISQE